MPGGSKQQAGRKAVVAKAVAVLAAGIEEAEGNLVMESICPGAKQHSHIKWMDCDAQGMVLTKGLFIKAMREAMKQRGIYRSKAESEMKRASVRYPCRSN